MKMMFHIDDFKCSLCSGWFCPPFNLPYLLPCTHSICTQCLQKATHNHTHQFIICPQDLQKCALNQININVSTKKALERLMKQHRNYSQNTQLQCIKALSVSFDQILAQKQAKVRNLQVLIDQIFLSEIQRLQNLHNKIKIDINRPYQIVQDWKEVVAAHLTAVKKNHSVSTYTTCTTNTNRLSQNNHKSNNSLQLTHYIEEGRKMKMELTETLGLDFDVFADKLMREPRACFQKGFGVNRETLENRFKVKYQSKGIQQKQKQKQKNGRKSLNPPTHNIQSNNKIVQQRQSRALNPLPISTNSQISEFRFNQSIVESKRTSRDQNNSQYVCGDLSKGYEKNFIKSTKQNRENRQNESCFIQRAPFSINFLPSKQQTPPRQPKSKSKFQIAQRQTPSPSLNQQTQANNRLAQMLNNNNISNNSMPNSQIKKQQRVSINNSMLASPQAIKEQYTQEEQQQLLNNDQIMDDNGWQLGNTNFLKEWKIDSQTSPTCPMQIRQNTYYYNCQKQKISYLRKMQMQRVQQILKCTVIKDNFIQLIGQSLHDIDMHLYLQQFDWRHSNIEIVKIVKAELTDEQLNVLLNYLLKSTVKALVLTHNNLTDVCLDAFLNFVNVNSLVKHIYLGKNYLNQLKIRQKVGILKQKGVTLYL